MTRIFSGRSPLSVRPYGSSLWRKAAAALAGNGGDQFAVEQNPQRGGVLSIFDHHLFRLVRHDSRLLHEPRQKIVAEVLAEADTLFQECDDLIVLHDAPPQSDSGGWHG